MKKYLSFVLAVLMLLACVPAGAKTDEPTREGIGMNVAGFNARLLKSTEYYDSSSVSQHTVTIMTLWADWCPSCQGYLPIVQQMYDHYMATPEQDVQFIGAVSLTQGCTETSATNYINNHGYTWTNVVPDSVLRAVFNTSGYIPQTLIVDRYGVVRAQVVGKVDSYEELSELTSSWLQTLREEYAACAGDIDGNGEVNATDALIAMRYALDILPLTTAQLLRGDVDGNGIVNSTDALLIFRRTLDMH